MTYGKFTLGAINWFVKFAASIVTSAVHSMVMLPNINSAKKFSVGSSCNGCGTCSKVCPRDNVTVNKEINNSKPIFGDKCEFCLACINHCPQKAIKLEKEKNPNARYKNENVTLKEIINAND